MQKSIHVLHSCLSVAVALLCFAPARAETTAAIVRTARPLAASGSVDDWKSITATHLIVAAWGEAAQFKAAFDDESFYLLVQVRDDSPLRNGSQLAEELIKGGDAISVCFGASGNTPPQRIVAALVDNKPVVVAMRPRWPEKRPYEFRSVGTLKMEHVAPLAAARTHFSRTPDGYIARMAIPWKALRLAPKVGDELPFDVQVIFSDAAGSLNVATAWWRCSAAGATATTDVVTEARLYEHQWGRARFFQFDPGPRPTPAPADDDDQARALAGPGEPIHFELQQPSSVSIVIRRADGWIYRELLRARRLPAGNHTVYFDGRDRNGLPLPPGEYQYRIAIFDRLQATIRGSVGNSGNPPWRTRDGLGSIGGVHGGPSAVFAGKRGIYMLHSGEEGQRCLRLVDPATGKARWFASVGVFGAGLAVCEAADDVYLLHHSGRQTRLTRLNADTGAVLKIGDQPYVRLEPKSPLSMAVIHSKAYISHQEGDQLQVVDLRDGTLGDKINVAAPRGLCAAHDGSLLICSSNKVLRCDLATGKISTLIDKLDAPHAVATDATGAIFVAEHGVAQQIRKFSAAGIPLAALGKRGGRNATVAPFDPLQLLNAKGIAIDARGHVWAVENESPRRFVELTAAGDWVRDYYGPAGHITVGVDLDDLSRVYYQCHQFEPSYVQTKIDYDAFRPDSKELDRTWKIEAVHFLSQNGRDNSAKPDLIYETAKAAYGKLLAFRATNGRRYLFKPSHASFALWVENGDRWRPVAALREIREPQQETLFWHWTDANGDGLAQEEEIDKRSPRGTEWTTIDRDLTLRGAEFDWPAAKINEHGAPLYDAADFTSTFAVDERPLRYYFEQQNYGVAHSPPGPPNVRYHSSNVGPEGGLHFWDRAHEARICRYVDGRLQWIAGHHNGRFRHNGDSLMVMNLAGELDGVLLATEVAANFIGYTHDGLCLGWLNADADGRPHEEGPTAWYVENMQPGIWVKDLHTGKRLLIAATTEDVRVIEVSGVFGDDLRRIDGTLQLQTVQPPAVTADEPDTILYATSVNTASGRYLGIDGHDTEWRRGLPTLQLNDDSGTVGEIRLRRDAGMLYVFADIATAAADELLPNDVAKQKWPRVELRLGPVEPSDRNSPIAGDTQLIFTAEPAGNKVVGHLQLYRPQAKPLTSSPDLRPLARTGEWEESQLPGPLDASRGAVLLPVAQVHWRPRLDSLGWRMEAAVPLAAVPELVARREVTFERGDRRKQTAERLDFRGPLRLSAVITRNHGDAPRHFCWPADQSRSLPNPVSWNPSKSPIVNGAVKIVWPEIDGATAYDILRAPSTDITAAKPIARVLGTRHNDNSSAAANSHYWLRPIDRSNGRQLLGPITPDANVASFVLQRPDR